MSSICIQAKRLETQPLYKNIISLTFILYILLVVRLQIKTQFGITGNCKTYNIMNMRSYMKPQGTVVAGQNTAAMVTAL